MFSFVYNVYYNDKLHALYELTEKLALEAGLSTTSSTRLKHACVKVSFDALIWEWVAPPSQLGQGGQSTQEQKHCILENSKKAKHFQQMLRLFVLRHKSPCCGKGCWKFSYGNLIQGQKAQTGPQLSFPSWFLLGMSISFDVFIFICSYLFIYLEVSPGGTFCSAWYSPWDRTGLSSFPHLSGFITMFLWGVWRPPVLMILPLFLLSQFSFTDFSLLDILNVQFDDIFLSSATIYSFTFCLVYAHKITQSNTKAWLCYPRPNPSVSSIALQQNTGCILPSYVPKPEDPTDHPLLYSHCILAPNSNGISYSTTDRVWQKTSRQYCQAFHVNTLAEQANIRGNTQPSHSLKT